MQEHCSFLAGSPKLLSLEICWKCLLTQEQSSIFENVFDTGKILNSLLLAFVVLEWVLEKNFKVI
jgi:hypothetical protein